MILYLIYVIIKYIRQGGVKVRDIKFRVWDGAKIISLSKAIYNDLVGVQHNREDGFDLESYYDNVELIQYTGLKDCQGKEVYEGDIIQYTATDITGEPITYRWPVKLQEGCYLCGHRPLREILKYFKGEKLGNIHEKPRIVRSDNNERS